MKFKLRETNEKNAAMEVMVDNEKYQNDPCLGIFWYDVNKKELFGVRSTLAQDTSWYDSELFKSKVRTDRRLHKNVWEKEHHKKQDSRFQGDYTKIPRGRVFEFETGFKVFTGKWVEECPEARELIIQEFQLPKNVQFIQDEHWDIGHGWSNEV